MKTGFPSPDQTGQLRSLWKEAFGDTDAFLDCFFRVAYAPERCRCISEDGTVKAALYWLDTDCDGQKCAYIYAVATAADSRGKGFCRTLMEDTAAVLRAGGYQGAILVPQDERLRGMYSRMGYLPATTIGEFSCTGSLPVSITEVTPTTYAALRRRFLPDRSVEIQGTTLAFLGELARFYAGKNFAAAVSRETDKLHILEYLGNFQAASGLVAALGFRQATVRTTGTTPFAMYRPLTPECQKPDYFPFAFD